MKDKMSVLEYIGTAVVAAPIIFMFAVITFPFALFDAWARMKLYAWFAIPYLHAPAIPYWAFVGIGLLLTMFRGSDSPNGYKPTVGDLANCWRSYSAM